MLLIRSTRLIDHQSVCTPLDREKQRFWRFAGLEHWGVCLHATTIFPGLDILVNSIQAETLHPPPPSPQQLEEDWRLCFHITAHQHKHLWVCVAAAAPEHFIDVNMNLYFNQSILESDVRPSAKSQLNLHHQTGQRLQAQRRLYQGKDQGAANLNELKQCWESGPELLHYDV